MPEKKPQSQDSAPDQNAQPAPVTPQEETQQPNAQPAPAAQQNPVSPASLTPENAPLTPKEEPKKLDETIPGGKYRNAAGQLVNANNEPIDDNGRVLKLQ